MKKLLFLILLSLGMSESTFSMKMDVDKPEVIPMEVDQPEKIDFTQVLPDELSLEVLEDLILRNENLEGALKEIYEVSKVSKGWRRLALDPVLIKKVINKFALTKEKILKEDAVIPLWNLLNNIRLANITLKKGESQEEINKKIEEADKKLNKPREYYFIYELIDNSAPAFLRIGTIIHNGEVRSVAFSPDSKYLATGSDDYTARIYDLNTKKVIDTITHNSWVFSVVFSPDSRYLATKTDDGKVNIYDLKEKKVIDNITGIVNSVAFSSDGIYLATGEVYNCIARIYDLNTKKVIDTITHDKPVISVAFSPDGRYLATGSRDCTAKIYDLKEKKVIDNITGIVTSVAFSPDGRYLVATGSEDNTAKIYDLKEKKVIDTITHNDMVISVAFSPDGRYLATRTDDGKVKIYDLKEKKVIDTITGWVTSTAFSPDGRYLATGIIYGRAVKIYDLKEKKVIDTITGIVNSVAFSSDGIYLATGADDKTAKIYAIIRDTNKKLFIKILDYLRTNKKSYPKSIFINYLYSKCNFTSNEQNTLKEDYGFEIKKEESIEKLKEETKESWQDWLLAKIWFK